MFEDFADIHVYIEVMRGGTLAAAAEKLDRTAASVGRRIRAIEKKAGAQLFTRKGRRLLPTREGELIFEFARRIAEELEGAEAQLKHLAGPSSGHLRITAPVLLGQAVFSKLVPEFMADNPECILFTNLTNRAIDLEEEGYDIALQIGATHRESLTSEYLGTLETGIYTAARGTWSYCADFRHPSELVGLPVMQFSNDDHHADILRLNGPREVAMEVGVRELIVSTDTQTLISAVHNELGLAVLPTFAGHPGVYTGELKRVLPDWYVARESVSIVLPTRRLIRPVVRAFLNFIHKRVGSAMLKVDL
ncbi:LysR family transcriptional regulator [Acanthopleuribacter pedis]|uniref:LysR family transcriptional regulator n=1 Tax=Acanthopleuribacter pedis TaxID=442870 RepID=A0A8J7U8W1_9BACT|nr:LysR family transcriptional regulator [Acanthopleuribacter pedis]MBO1323001.1 LysR family transcriptional regulator [Acanthopleuribacter pedis]